MNIQGALIKRGSSNIGKKKKIKCSMGICFSRRFMNVCRDNINSPCQYLYWFFPSKTLGWMRSLIKPRRSPLDPVPCLHLVFTHPPATRGSRARATDRRSSSTSAKLHLGSHCRDVPKAFPHICQARGALGGGKSEVF